MTEAFTIAVLAGGKSSRMGADKSLIPIDGKPLIQYAIERLRPLNMDTMLITNYPERHAHLGLPMYSDVIPGKGSLGGIYTALYHSTTPYVFCVACDMPFLDPAMVNFMVEQAPGYDIVVPQAGERLQSLHAFYHRNCREMFHQHIERDHLKIISIYNLLKTRVIAEESLRRFDPDLRVFINVNTPQDLETIKDIINNKQH